MDNSTNNIHWEVVESLGEHAVAVLLASCRRQTPFSPHKSEAGQFGETLIDRVQVSAELIAENRCGYRFGGPCDGSKSFFVCRMNFAKQAELGAFSLNYHKTETFQSFRQIFASIWSQVFHDQKPARILMRKSQKRLTEQFVGKRKVKDLDLGSIDDRDTANIELFKYLNELDTNHSGPFSRPELGTVLTQL